VVLSVCVNDKCFHAVDVPPFFSHASRNDKEDVDEYNDNISADGDRNGYGEGMGIRMGMPHEPVAA